ncbi:urea amidolyase associated protein UAAP1 [Micromonospora endophytica]|uniref:urea amidolyase associated protein UAAP1 n=1 Tax=Micromonospora endophytica TaxID=515350 RepID=UPI001BB34D26|nr:urea amidolyase associated protein UAAP1 [Micromonospora endophytica]BCJ62087.1 urea carboxylase [Micromonospora endophytica]
MTDVSGYQHDVPGGAAWSLTLARGSSLRLTALGTDAVASMLIYAADRRERLNVPDTLKAQMSARIHPPMVLMSDLGKALASVTGSSSDWHDAISGHSLDGDLARFGPSDYGRDRNQWRRSARSLLLDELYVHGLGERDLHATVNWFVQVRPRGDERGTLDYVPGHTTAGDWVSLRAEQDLLVVFATAPHPLDPAARWQPAGVRADVAAGVPAPADDPSRAFRAESARALAAAERSVW